MNDDTDLGIRARMKEEIRRRMRALRKAYPEQARSARSMQIAERASALEELSRARVVAGYVAMRGEADPSMLLQSALARGGDVALPRVDAERGMLVLHRHRPTDELFAGPFGLLEPSADASVVDPEEVDFVLVPALAVDPSGHRIGYGKGFYDRLLPSLTRATSCCIAFSFQLISEAPVMPGDVAVDIVVTDDRTLRVGNR